MSRPNKSGLDYFPLDVHVDEKIELIEAKYGITGFGVVIKLFQNIYKNGYFLEVTEDRLLLLSKRINVDINSINAIINDCLRWELFDIDLYDRYSVLTSLGVQKRYIEATKRRKDIEFIDIYLLIDSPKDLYPERVNVCIKKINVDTNQIKDNINPQSKVKESKVKESKVYNISSPDGEDIPTPPEGIKPDPTKTKTPPCPHKEIIRLWHEKVPSLPTIQIWGEKSQANLRSRWNEDKNRQNIDWWARFFEYISTSDFLMGRAKEWNATLEWIVRPTNFQKVINGHYKNKRNSTGSRITDQNINAAKEFLNG